MHICKVLTDSKNSFVARATEALHTATQMAKAWVAASDRLRLQALFLIMTLTAVRISTTAAPYGNSIVFHHHFINAALLLALIRRGAVLETSIGSVGVIATANSIYTNRSNTAFVSNLVCLLRSRSIWNLKTRTHSTDKRPKSKACVILGNSKCVFWLKSCLKI